MLPWTKARTKQCTRNVKKHIEIFLFFIFYFFITGVSYLTIYLDDKCPTLRNVGCFTLSQLSKTRVREG